MPTLINRAKATDDLTGGREPIDFGDIIYQLDDDQGNRSPLTAFLGNVAKEEAEAAKFTMYEREMLPKWDAVNEGAGYTAGATAITVDNGPYFRPGDLIKVPRTGEVLKVDSISTNALTVTRSVGDAGGTDAAALVDNDPLLIISNANPEFAGARAILTNEPDEMFNYTQIIRTPFGVSGTLNTSNVRQGNVLAQERVFHALEHRVDIERAILFGERNKITAANGKPERYTGGLFYWLQDNIETGVGTLTETIFETWLEKVFAYGSGRKTLLCAPRFVSAINHWAKGNLQTVPKDQTYGISVKEYLSAHGELSIVKHNLFDGTIYGGTAVILDFDWLKLRPKTGRDTMLRPNIQNNDEDGIKDEYLTEVGLQVLGSKAHGVMKGVTSWS